MKMPRSALQVVRMTRDQVNRIVLEPLPPPFRNQLSGLEIERQSETVRRGGIRIVRRRHREIHQAMHIGAARLRLAPDALQEALDAPVVDAVGRSACVDRALGAAGPAVFRELVERARPITAVDEIEVRVSRVVRDRAPVSRVLHPVDHRSVTARGFAEAAAVLARGKRAKFTVDERNELANQIVRVPADRAGVDVLIATKRGEAIRKRDDHRSHLALVNQAEPRAPARSPRSCASSCATCRRPKSRRNRTRPEIGRRGRGRALGRTAAATTHRARGRADRRASYWPARRTCAAA